jgi:hypothetical protein
LLRVKYRDSRGLDLSELFTEYDTGHDKSNRFYRLCKGSARACPATVYYSGYKLYDKTLTGEGGGIVPAAIVYTKNKDGSYTFKKYIEAKDGSYFKTTIQIEDL